MSFPPATPRKQIKKSLLEFVVGFDPGTDLNNLEILVPTRWAPLPGVGRSISIVATGRELKGGGTSFNQPGQTAETIVSWFVWLHS